MSEIPKNIQDMINALDTYYQANPEHRPKPKKEKKNKSNVKLDEILNLVKEQNKRLETLEEQNKILTEKLKEKEDKKVEQVVQVEEDKPVEKVIRKAVKTNKHKTKYSEETKTIRNIFKSKGYKGYRIKKIIEKLKEWSGVEPKSVFYEKIKYKKSRIIEFMFNGNFTKDIINSTTNKLSHYLERKGIKGEIQNAIDYNDLSWRSGRFGEIGKYIDSHDPTYNGAFEYTSPNSFKKFAIYLILEDDKQQQPEQPQPNQEQAEMGTDFYKNNCLWNCLNHILGDNNPWKKPENLKTFCKLKYCDKIPLDKIPEIEKKLKGYSINISGDYEYISPIQSNKIIYLKLKDSHIKIDYERANKQTNCRTEEKQIVLYDKISKIGFDGSKEWELTQEEKYEYEHSFNSKYLLVYRFHITNKARKTGQFKTLKEEYGELISEFDKIKKETNGEINFYKTGSVKLTAQTLFNKFSLFLSQPEKLADYENRWIKLATCGALSYSNNDYEGELHCYDINSMYGGIMLGSNKLAIKQGELKTLTKEEFDNIKYFPYGIYRCQISKSEDENINKFFRYNQYNYYTHISLEQARNLNLNIALIEDSEPNNLFYSRDKIITFSEVFKKYVNYLYDLKLKKVSPYIKQLLNILWGSFCEVNKQKKYIGSKTEKELVISDEYVIDSMRPITTNDDIKCIKVIRKLDNYYKTPYARISPFIISIGRKRMSDLFYKYADKVQYIRCDGIKSSEKLNIELGSDIGDLRYEGYYSNAKIINLNNIQGDYNEF